MGFFGKSKAQPRPMGGGVPFAPFPPQPAFRGAASTAVSPYPMGHVPPAIKHQGTATLKASLNDLQISSELEL
jgi:hypothetical protein